MRPTASRHEHGCQAIALHNKNARLTIPVGERFNFPTKAFSALAITSVPGDGLRISVVFFGSQYQYTTISLEINAFSPFSYRPQADGYHIFLGRVAGTSIIFTIGDS